MCVSSGLALSEGSRALVSRAGDFPRSRLGRSGRVPEQGVGEAGLGFQDFCNDI